MRKLVQSTVLAILGLFSFSAMAQDLIGITQDDKLFTMASIGSPGIVSTPVAITGMAAGQTVVGADYRPLTGELYILGYNGTTNSAQLYTLNTTTAVATAVGSAMTLALGSNMGVGFDFNPTVDRIRVVGANKKNYRINPVTGTIAATDADLAFAGTDINAAATATIGAVAYSNSYVGSTTTTLYNYDLLLNVLTTQNPPNNGTLNTIGSSGLVVNTLTHSIDMDIYMDPVTLTNMAYLAANTGAAINDNLYIVNLTAGTATSLGLIGGGLDVKNIALPLNRTMPAPTGRMVFGIQANTNTLLSFDTDNPRLIRSYMPVTGITAGQIIVGIDFRPANMQLYALGYDNIASNYQLYTINTTTGAATAVNTTATNINLGLTNNIAFDFNPVADRIRVISRMNGANYRLNPVDGSIAATDTAVMYMSGDINFGKNPSIGAVAYTNSYMNAATTGLFALDDSLGALVTINSPNGGTLSTTTSSLISVNLSDRTTDIDFFYDSVTSTNVGYISANTGTDVNDKLYTVTTAGTLTLVSDIGLGISMSDIAVRPQFKNVVGIASTTAAKKTFMLYPNPATDALYIEANSHNTPTSLFITDITGRTIRTSPFTSKVSIADLHPGVYFIKVSSGDGVYETQKFLKQ